METPEDIMLAALAYENHSIVGIYGFPGIIGTRLATLVGEKAKKQNLVSRVLMATADELQSRLKILEEGILIIANQVVPETFDLIKKNIESQKPCCKIIITSQFQSVFLGLLGATKIFAAATTQHELGIWTIARSSAVPKPSGGLLDLDRMLKGEESNLCLKRISKSDLACGVKHQFMKGSIDTHHELSSVPIGGNRGDNLPTDISENSLCSGSRKSTITEIVYTAPPEDCILFCSVLPPKCIFTKEMLVSQWTALGFIQLDEDEKMEEVCSQCFDTLLNSEYIVAAGYDHFFDRPYYKVGDKMIAVLEKKLLEPKFQISLDGDVTKTEHLLLDYKDIDLIDLGILKRCSRLQTLIIHRCYGSKVKRLHSDLFRELQSLKILNVSRTNVEYLSDLDNLKELRYLDISETPISLLNKDIGCLSNLETLKLDRCPNIDTFPDSMSELINLQHLTFRVVDRLGMPKGIGKLTKLQTLSAFWVRDCDGYRIGELKYLNKLKGALGIWRLQKVMSKEEAVEACLCDKHGLRKIELNWTQPWNEKNTGEEEILESLEPPLGIQELSIWFYGGGVFPSWMSSPKFSELVNITLSECRYFDSLPCLGALPSLKHLEISKNDELTEISSYLCRKQTDQHHHVAFPKLEKLSFQLMYKLEKWTGLEKGDFPCLNSLRIAYCPVFVALPQRLSQLKSLSYMRLDSCPTLSCLPEDGGRPPMLKTLWITDCHRLKERYCGEEECWSKCLRF